MYNLSKQSFGRYKIQKPLGEGGMAAVYLGYDGKLNREVAIKVILPGQQHSPQFLKRFEREAQTLAKLTHPNIVPVIDYGEKDGIPYLVMPYLSGGTLKQRINAQPIPYTQAARMLIPIARALHYVHQNGIIHRDIKPANILLTASSEVMLSDFGIAHLMENEDLTQLTGSGMGIGTPAYMSPEQGRGDFIDFRSDIYALGIVFYEMLTGKAPFQANTPMGVIFKHINEAPPKPRQFVPDLPAVVERALLTTLEKDPARRFSSMETFACALETFITQEVAFSRQTERAAIQPAENAPVPRQAQPSTPKKKRPLRNFFRFLLFLCLFGALGLALFSYLKPMLGSMFQSSPGVVALPGVCVDWSEISLSDLGKEQCVRGLVKQSFTRDNVFYIIFSNSPEDFFFLSYDGAISGTDGLCVQYFGKVEQLGSTPVMVIRPEKLENCH